MLMLHLNEELGNNIKVTCFPIPIACPLDLIALFKSNLLKQNNIIKCSSVFYVYGSVILWSFYQEERDIEIAKSLRNRAPPLTSIIQEAAVNPGPSTTKK